MSGKRKAVSPTEAARRKRNKAIVPAMRAKQKSLKKIKDVETRKKGLQFTGEYASGGKYAFDKLGLQQSFPLKQLGGVLKWLENQGIGLDPTIKDFGDPPVRKTIKNTPYKDKIQPPGAYEKHYKKYKTAAKKITPEDKESIMSKIKKKRKGGKVISYKMTGGQVVAAGYDK